MSVAHPVSADTDTDISEILCDSKVLPLRLPSPQPLQLLAWKPPLSSSSSSTSSSFSSVAYTASLPPLHACANDVRQSLALVDNAIAAHLLLRQYLDYNVQTALTTTLAGKSDQCTLSIARRALGILIKQQILETARVFNDPHAGLAQLADDIQQAVESYGEIPLAGLVGAMQKRATLNGDGEYVVLLAVVVVSSVSVVLRYHYLMQSYNFDEFDKDDLSVAEDGTNDDVGSGSKEITIVISNPEQTQTHKTNSVSVASTSSTNTVKATPIAVVTDENDKQTLTHYKLTAHLVDLGRTAISKFYKLSLTALADGTGITESSDEAPEDHILFLDQSCQLTGALPAMPQLLVIGLASADLDESTELRLRITIKSQYLAAIKNIGESHYRLGILVLATESLMASYWIMGFLNKILAPLRQPANAKTLTNTKAIPPLKIVVYSKYERNANAIRFLLNWVMRADTDSTDQ